VARRIVTDATTDGAALRLHPDASEIVMAGQRVRPRALDESILVATDVAELRKSLGRLPSVGPAKMFRLDFVRPDVELPVLRLRPHWPRLAAMRVERGECFTIYLTFSAPVPSRQVWAAIAAATAPLQVGWPVVESADPDLVVPADHRLGQPGDAGPDVVLWRRGSVEPEVVLDEVLRRPPVLVGVAPAVSWEEYDADPAGWVDPMLGAFDPGAHRPIGIALPAEPVAQPWRSGKGPIERANQIVEAAMRGEPLLLPSEVPGWARLLLGPALIEQLVAQVEPAGLASHSEVRSLRIRRAAHAAHAVAGWRRKVAERSGLPAARLPSVSALLTTKRPEQVAFALEQLRRQDHTEVEIIVVAHGFDPGPVEGALVVHVDAGVPFGAVLTAGSGRASGDLLLKVDDDDWYAESFISDLMLARSYTGAEIVGCPQEFIHLAGSETTIRHAWPTEVYADYVAGGSMLVDRSALAAVGGFRPVHKHVDAALLGLIRANGGSVYRTQGLGYQACRRAEGHTWATTDAEWLDDPRFSGRWPGLRFTPIFEATAAADRGGA
jgi:hypothetical protein